MRVLVTGGAGFIGSHIVDQSREAGDTVAVVDNLSRGRASRLPDDVPLHQIDITDAAALAGVITEFNPDVIYHLAAQADVRVSVERPAFDAEVNVVGTINVLEAARQVDARVVFSSTGGAIYGEGPAIPIPTSEAVIPEPEAPYGCAKFCAEQYLWLYNRLHGTRHSALRFGNVYGPRQDPGGDAGVVSIIAGKVAAGQSPTIFGDGTQTRDYVYVRDVVAAFLVAGHSDRSGLWNIGTGVEVSVLDIIAGFEAACGQPITPTFAPARPGELLRSCLDASKARAELNFAATVPVTEGIERVWTWVKAGEPDRGQC